MSLPAIPRLCLALFRRLTALSRTWRMSLLCVVLALLSSPASALCLGPNCSCGISTAPLSFGVYNPLSAGPVDSSTNVRVSCGGIVSLLINYQVSLSAGGGTVANRRMSSGGAQLAYNLYSDAARTTVWGDGSNGSWLLSASLTLSVLGAAPPRDYPIYGRLAAGQRSALPGSYTDTVTVTITYF